MKNYRPNSLLSAAYKVFTKVTSYRIKATLDFNEPGDQAGLLKGYSTIDHIYTVDEVIEKSAEYNQPVYRAFIDCEKGFHSFATAAISADEPYVKVLEDIYKGSTATIVLDKERSKIRVKKGIRQRDPIRPLLLTACLQEVFRILDSEQSGIRVNLAFLTNLRFADEVALLSHSGDQLLSTITDTDRQSRLVGLRITVLKTKVMFNSICRKQRSAIGSEPPEVLRDYIYLGPVLTTDPNHKYEVTRRIRMGWTAYIRHSQIMNGRLPVSLKRNVYNSCILPALTYGSETWRLTKRV